MFTFAQFSDIHLGQDRGDGGARARERTERVLACLSGVLDGLDAVLLTGDIADHGREDEYTLAAKLFADHGVQPLICPGNHDARGAYRAVLRHGDAADTSPVDEVHRLPGATFLMCDSSVPGKGHGRLDDATLGWLDRELARTPDGAPAFVCFHHPPVPLYGQYVDPIRQFGGGTAGRGPRQARHGGGAAVRAQPHPGRDQLRGGAAGRRTRCGLHAEDALGGRGGRAGRLHAAPR